MLLYLFTANVLQYFQAVVKTGGEGGGASEEGEREGERCDLSMPLLSCYCWRNMCTDGRWS